eukprot:CAMPEP_0195518096 /NCGR_PEP_ID=MMETSP0794_2-20130614/12227_1 /TAXON_ID=515487 /ORGANISM="Stephanopyxis turris, Strain CCMP 815" /LENGTH=286 /DNA_ID=CAMNT_0040647007 /DNA_START=380 /DNA_END=1240 /DNA_ORIENTATION=-
MSLAMAGTIIKNPDSLYLKILFALQATIVPILLNAIYEVTYLVHKRRSVNFCGLFFDEGKRVKYISTVLRSFFLRNLIRMLGILLLVMGIVANFDILGVESQNEFAGMTGWWALYPWDESKVHLLLSLLPTMVLLLTCFYLSIALWRYGTNSSMVVHSSVCNPWFFPFFGTIALAVGQLFDENYYLITSSCGLVVLIFSVILVMKEVDKDMQAAAEFSVFLNTVKRMGNNVTVRNVERGNNSASVVADGSGGAEKSQKGGGKANNTAPTTPTADAIVDGDEDIEER